MFLQMRKVSCPVRPAPVAALLLMAVGGVCTAGELVDAKPAVDVYDAFYSKDIDTTTFRGMLKSKALKDVRAELANLRKTTPSTCLPTVGKLDSFDFAPPSYTSKHVHAVLYYRPKSSQEGKLPTRVLFILHGGGASTSNDDAAKKVAASYLQGFIPLADHCGMVMIAPASDFGWNFATSFLLHDLAATVRAELDVDSNQFYLYGHSMGGMGVTREAQFLVDIFAGFISEASGMQPTYQTDWRLRTYFNTRFVQINGTDDHFNVGKPDSDSFIMRSRAVAEKIKAMEQELKCVSGYTLVEHPKEHNPRMDLIQDAFEKDLFPHSRNLYLADLHPVGAWVNVPQKGNSPALEKRQYGRFMWIEVTDIADGVANCYPAGRATAKDNVITIAFTEPRVRHIRVYLSERLVDFAKDIEITLNGRSAFKGVCTPDVDRMIEAARAHTDQTFLFENWIDLDVAR